MTNVNKLYKDVMAIIRFESHIKYPTNIGECWNWNGPIHKPIETKNNYGILYYNGKRYSAHRAAWVIHFGEIPINMHILHKCDNPQCVNPNHLFIGTNTDNIVDKVAKGRQGHGFIGKKHSLLTKKSMSNSQINRFKNSDGHSKQSIKMMSENRCEYKLSSKDQLDIATRTLKGESQISIARSFLVPRGVIARVIKNSLLK